MNCQCEADDERIPVTLSGGHKAVKGERGWLTCRRCKLRAGEYVVLNATRSYISIQTYAASTGHVSRVVVAIDR